MTDYTKAQLAEQLTHQQASRMRAENDLIDFKQLVREVAVRVAHEQGWCTEGLNETLDELGLEPMSTEYTFRATVTVDLRVTISDTDFDGSDAEEYLRDKVENLEVTVNTGWSDDNEWTTEGTGIEQISDVKAVTYK